MRQHPGSAATAVEPQTIVNVSLDVGDWMDVMDGEGTWNVAQVLSFPTPKEVEVKYDGWGSQYNEVVLLNSDRVAPYHTYTWSVKVWAKYKNWPWWPSIVTIRSPGTEAGRAHLQSEERLFVDFLDRKDIAKRCRCWIDRSKIESFEGRFDERRKKTTGSDFESSLALCLQSTASNKLPSFVKSSTLPVQFATVIADPVKKMKKSMGIKTWAQNFNTNRRRHRAVYVYKSKDGNGDGDDDDDNDQVIEFDELSDNDDKTSSTTATSTTKARAKGKGKAPRKKPAVKQETKQPPANNSSTSGTPPKIPTMKRALKKSRPALMPEDFEEAMKGTDNHFGTGSPHIADDELPIYLPPIDDLACASSDTKEDVRSTRASKRKPAAISSTLANPASSEPATSRGSRKRKAGEVTSATTESLASASKTKWLEELQKSVARSRFVAPSDTNTATSALEEEVRDEDEAMPDLGATTAEENSEDLAAMLALPADQMDDGDTNDFTEDLGVDDHDDDDHGDHGKDDRHDEQSEVATNECEARGSMASIEERTKTSGSADMSASGGVEENEPVQALSRTISAQQTVLELLPKPTAKPLVVARPPPPTANTATSASATKKRKQPAKKTPKSLADERIAAAQAVLATLDDGEDDEEEIIAVELALKLTEDNDTASSRPETLSPLDAAAVVKGKGKAQHFAVFSAIQADRVGGDASPIVDSAEPVGESTLTTPLQQQDQDQFSPGKSTIQATLVEPAGDGSRRSRMRAGSAADGTTAKSLGKTPVWVRPPRKFDEPLMLSSDSLSSSASSSSSSPRSTSTVLGVVPVHQVAFSSLSLFQSSAPFSLDKWIKKDLYTQHLSK